MARITTKTAFILPSACLLFAMLSLVPTSGFAQETVSAPAKNAPAIVVTEVTKRTLIDRVIASGTVKPVEEVYVAPMLDGLAIKALNVDIGDKVEKDTVLAQLNGDSLILQKSQMQATKAKSEASLAQLHAQMVEAQANAEQAQQQQARTRELVKKGTVSTASVEQADAAAASANARVVSAQQAILVAEADIKVVESQIADLDLKLARTDVKAPFAGIVSGKNARVGAIALGNSQPLFTMIREGKVELVAEAPEDEIGKIQAGQKATLTLAGGREPLSGTVRLVSPTVDPTTRLGLVYILIDDSSKARSGMYGSAQIITGRTENAALPVSAVLVEEGRSSARKVENDKVRFVDVVTGIQDNGFVEIRGGLKPGDQVVAKAGAYVRDGDRINPVRDQTAASN